MQPCKPDTFFLPLILGLLLGIAGKLITDNEGWLVFTPLGGMIIGYLAFLSLSFPEKTQERFFFWVFTFSGRHLANQVLKIFRNWPGPYIA